MNVAPLGAMALFGAAYFKRQSVGLLIIMASWFMSDLILNNFVYNSAGSFTLFTQGSFFIYLSILAIYFLGDAILKKVSLKRVVIGSLSASAVFYILSNFGVWMQGGLYPLTLDGLMQCYIAAVPFLKNTLIGDMAYSGILFLVYERAVRANLIEKHI